MAFCCIFVRLSFWVYFPHFWGTGPVLLLILLEGEEGRWWRTWQCEVWSCRSGQVEGNMRAIPIPTFSMALVFLLVMLSCCCFLFSSWALGSAPWKLMNPQQKFSDLMRKGHNKQAVVQICCSLIVLFKKGSGTMDGLFFFFFLQMFT